MFPVAHKSTDADMSSVGIGTDFAPTDAAVLAWFYDRLNRASCAEKVLVQGLLKRELFKRLWVLSFDLAQQQWETIVDSWDHLDRYKRHKVSLEFERVITKQLSPTKTVSVTNLKGDTAFEIIQERTSAEKPWLIVDIPGIRPGSEVGIFYVLEGQRRKLRHDDRSVGDLHESQVWKRYAKNLHQVAGKIRVFCDPQLVDTIEASIPLELGIDILKTVLTELSQ